MKIPDRWLAYSALGKCIPGTRFICFKVPLKDTLCRNLQVHERFTPSMLIEQCPKLGLVIDLTNTNRYYSGEAFKSSGIQYEKLRCPGQIIPPGTILQEFFRIVDAYLHHTQEQDKLIGVHCTHGLNRTGYFICRYLSLRMGFSPKDAISVFEDARGHKIERQPFIEDIIAGRQIEIPALENDEVSKIPDKHPPQNHEYRRNGYNHNRPPPGPHYQPPGPYSTPPEPRYPPQKRPYPYPEARYPPPEQHYPPPEPKYKRNDLDYVSPLAGCSYDEYEVNSRYSRGYGNRGNYRGYSQHRNNPYGNHNNSIIKKRPYKEEESHHGNKKSWKR